MTESRFIGSLLGCAIGDALGAAYEGVRRMEGKLIFRGRWTDDTHMMMGVAESLIERGRVDQEHMLSKFIENWEEEPWRGYGPGPPAIFTMVRRGTPWMEASSLLYGGSGSFGNGAAMRVAPIGLFFKTPDELRRAAHLSSEITHAHPLGKEGAALEAYAVSLSSRATRIDPARFLNRLEGFAESDIFKGRIRASMGLLTSMSTVEVVGSLGNSVESFNSVPAAIFSFARNHEDFVDAVSYAVGLGGDTDTIGAMTGAIAGAYHGAEGIPAEWRRSLEREEYIESLGKRLWEIRSGR